MLSISFLASGKLGYKVLCEVFKHYPISVVLTDKKSNDIINFCSLHQIKYFLGNPRNGRVEHIIEMTEVDVVLSVNYLYLIERDLINWPKKYAINFHGSLLPKYRGRTPHVWAIINNEKETGITAHLIDEGCDTGHIIDQLKFKIDEYATGAMILDKFNLLYPEFVKKILSIISRGAVPIKKQDHSKATYFSKRTPEDGRINWDWQKERIYNWVRAQAPPYPGAFCFYDNYKIIINAIEFSDEGFCDTIMNGMVLKLEGKLPIVKTQNGAIKILDYLIEKNIPFEVGQVFI